MTLLALPRSRPWLPITVVALAIGAALVAAVTVAGQLTSGAGSSTVPNGQAEAEGAGDPQVLDLPAALPAFEGLYLRESVNQVGMVDTRRIRLTYDGPRSWSTETLEASNPDVAGNVHSFDGEHSTWTNAKTGIVEGDDAEGGVEVPFDFAFYHPGIQKSLAGESLALESAIESLGWSVVEATPEILTLEQAIGEPYPDAGVESKIRVTYDVITALMLSWAVLGDDGKAYFSLTLEDYTLK
jgi:hypothetical protein